MKKMISVILACVLIITTGMSTSAALPETIEPLWDNIATIVNDMSFNGTSGNASASIVGKSGTTKITGTLTVYRQSGDNWIYVGQDSDTVTTGYMALSVDFNGYSEVNYKSVFSITVTRNGMSESESDTAYKTCPKS